MHIPAFYVDTSVVGGYFDDEFIGPTRRFWEQAKQGRFRVLVSSTVATELIEAPERVRRFFADHVLKVAQVIVVNVEMTDLAGCYLRAGVVSPSYEDDAIHVAAAVIARARALVSWNFQHLVNIQRENGFNSVNLLQGYPAIRIISPSEAVEYENETKLD